MSFRLEKSERQLKHCLEEERKKVSESEAALKEEKGKLQETTAELVSTQNKTRSLEKEAESLHQRIRALEEAVGRLQDEVDRARAELRERGAEERRLCLNVEQLETDLRSSKAFTESLQAELPEKEQREVEMLGEKERAVAEVLVRSDPQNRQPFHNVLIFSPGCPNIVVRSISGCRGGQKRGRQQCRRSREGAGAEAGGTEGPERKAADVRGREQPQESQTGLFYEGHGLLTGRQRPSPQRVQAAGGKAPTGDPRPNKFDSREQMQTRFPFRAEITQFHHTIPQIVLNGQYFPVVFR